MVTRLYDLVVKIKEHGPRRVVVAQAEEHEVLLAINDAVEEGIAKGILVGDIERISMLLSKHRIKSDRFKIIDSPAGRAAVDRCCELVRSGQADVMMKGAVATSDFMKGILDPESGLGTGKLLSHVAVFEIDNYKKLLFVTDAAINIAPDVEQKTAIVQNAVGVAHALGIEKPKVAPIAAVELVKPGKMAATEDAAILTMMNRRGQITGCIIDGPLGLDNAVSREAAQIKGIDSPVAGDADILLAPDIESGNFIYKTLTTLCKARCAAIVVGTSAPCVLTSRSDDHETKLMSIALGVASASSW